MVKVWNVMKYQFYTLFGKCGINTSYKRIYVHSSCLCRVPGELTNTYWKCKLLQFPFQSATYLDIHTFFLTFKNEQVIRKIQYRGMVVVAHAWNIIHP